MQNRSFPGATLKHLKYYVVPSLIDETPLQRIILHGGCNDVNNKNSAPGKVANEIADMAVLCRDYGVNNIFISAMICRRGKFLNEKVKRVNFLLKFICEENGYYFIVNSNIEIRDLSKYGISPYDDFLEAHAHGNIEHTYSQLLKTKNCESISTKSILNTNTSNEVNNENNVLKNLRLKTRIKL